MQQGEFHTLCASPQIGICKHIPFHTAFKGGYHFSISPWFCHCPIGSVWRCWLSSLHISVTSDKHIYAMLMVERFTSMATKSPPAIVADKSQSCISLACSLSAVCGSHSVQLWSTPSGFLQKLAWDAQEPQERKLNFLPAKFKNLRSVPAYARFVQERFERCLDLYLCPRQRKLRVSSNSPFACWFYCSSCVSPCPMHGMPSSNEGLVLLVKARIDLRHQTYRTMHEINRTIELC